MKDIEGDKRRDEDVRDERKESKDERIKGANLVIFVPPFGRSKSKMACGRGG